MKRFVIGDQFQKGKGIAKGVEVGLLNQSDLVKIMVSHRKIFFRTVKL